MPDNQSAEQSRRTALLIVGLVLLFIAGYFFFREDDSATSVPDSDPPVTTVQQPEPELQGQSESGDDVSQTEVREDDSVVRESIPAEPDDAEDTSGTSQGETAMDAKAADAVVGAGEEISAQPLPTDGEQAATGVASGGHAAPAVSADREEAEEPVRAATRPAGLGPTDRQEERDAGAGVDDAADAEADRVNGTETGVMHDQSAAAVGAESLNQADIAMRPEVSGSAPQASNGSSAEPADIGPQDSQSIVSPTGGNADRGAANSSPEGGQVAQDGSSASLRQTGNAELFGMVDDLEKKFGLSDPDDGSDGAQRSESPLTFGSSEGDDLISDRQFPLNGSGQVIVSRSGVETDVLPVAREGEQQADSGAGPSDDKLVDPQVSLQSVGEAGPVAELESALDDLGAKIVTDLEAGTEPVTEDQVGSSGSGTLDDVRPQRDGAAGDRDALASGSDSSAAGSSAGVNRPGVETDVLPATREVEQQADSGAGSSDDKLVDPQVSLRSVGKAGPVAELESALDDLGAKIVTDLEAGTEPVTEDQVGSSGSGTLDDVRPQRDGAAGDRDALASGSDSSAAGSSAGVSSPGVETDVLPVAREVEQQADSGAGLSDDKLVDPQVSLRSVGEAGPVAELESALDDSGAKIVTDLEAGTEPATEDQVGSSGSGTLDDVRPQRDGAADDRDALASGSDSSATGSPVGDKARNDPEAEDLSGRSPDNSLQAAVLDSADAETAGGEREDKSLQTAMLAEPENRKPETGSTVSAPDTVPPVIAPEFDTVRVDKFGIALIAGRAEPETRIQAVVNNEVMLEQSVGRRGDFAIIFEVDTSVPALEITLRTLTDDGQTIPSNQSVVVLQTDLQPVGAAELETADTLPSEEPGKSAGGIQPLQPAVLMSSAGAVRLIQQAFPVLDSQTLVEMISYDESGEAVLGGRASSLNGLVRIYVDNIHVKDAEIRADKSWSSSLKDILPGRYVLRVDEVSLTGKVVGRVEMPLQKEDEEFVKAMLQAAAESVSSDSGVDVALVPQLVTVQRGYTLWGISRSRFGLGRLYVNIFDLNKDQIRDPDLIYPGQIFKIPQADNLYDPEYDRIYVPRPSSVQRN